MLGSDTIIAVQGVAFEMKANALIRRVLCAGLVDMASRSSTAVRIVGARRVAVLRVIGDVAIITRGEAL